MNGLALEVVAEAEIAQHFEKRMVPGRVADVLQVIVLAAGAHAALRGGRARIIAHLLAEKHVLELDHAGVGEQQRRIVPRHERTRRQHRMAVLAKEFQEASPDFRARHRFQSSVAFHVSSVSAASRSISNPKADSYLSARETSVTQESRLALPVGVVARQLRAKFLLPGFSQLHNPVRKGVEAFLDQIPLQAMPAQIGAHTQAVPGPAQHDRPRSSPCSADHRAIFRRAALRAAARRPPHRNPSRAAYGVNPRRSSRGGRAHRAPPRGPRAHRGARPPGGPGRYASLTSPPRFMVAFSGINLARICPSMSLAISGCCCRKVRALSLPWPIRSPL